MENLLDTLFNDYERVAKSTARTIEGFAFFHEGLDIDFHVKMMHGNYDNIQVSVTIGNATTFAYAKHDHLEEERTSNVRRIVLKLLHQAKTEYEEKLAKLQQA